MRRNCLMGGSHRHWLYDFNQVTNATGILPLSGKNKWTNKRIWLNYLCPFSLLIREQNYFKIWICLPNFWNLWQLWESYVINLTLQERKSPSESQNILGVLGGYQVTFVEGVQYAMSFVSIDSLILPNNSVRQTELSSFYRWWIWSTGSKLACPGVYSTFVTDCAVQPNSGSGAYDLNHYF